MQKALIYKQNSACILGLNLYLEIRTFVKRGIVEIYYVKQIIDSFTDIFYGDGKIYKEERKLLK